MAIIYAGGRGSGKTLATIKYLSELKQPVVVPNDRYGEYIEKTARGLRKRRIVMKDNEIRKMYNKLCDLYPHESFGSRSSVFIRALRNNMVTEEEFEAAREYYGSLWNYCGD